MWQKCPICNGTGQYDQFNSGIFSSVCPTCNGQRIISELTGLPPRVNYGQELINDNDIERENFESQHSTHFPSNNNPYLRSDETTPNRISPKDMLP